MAAGATHQLTITDLFEKTMLFYLQAEDSKYAELADGSAEVSINVSAKKFEASDDGKETELPLHALLGIAALGDPDAVTGVPEVLFLAKRQVQQAAQAFIVRVVSKPTAPGIGPFNKMINRKPEANVKSATPQKE